MTKTVNSVLTVNEARTLICLATNDKSVTLTYGADATWLEVRRENDWAFAELEKMRAHKEPIYHNDDSGDWNECPMCGAILVPHGATGHTDVGGVPAETEASWLECENCGYIN